MATMDEMRQREIDGMTKLAWLKYEHAGGDLDRPQVVFKATHDRIKAASEGGNVEMLRAIVAELEEW